MTSSASERIAKVIARAGVCSRRNAEALIAEGRVSYQGKKVETPAFKVDQPEAVAVDGKALSLPEVPRLWRYHKPPGLMTTHRDPQGRKTLFETLPKNLPRVISVGRLDLYSEGLLLLTNSGELARSFELPSSGWRRVYRVLVQGALRKEDLDTLRGGVTIEGIRYREIKAHLERKQKENTWVRLELREGKNREIRRIMAHFGVTVLRLVRISYGPFELGDLALGEVEEVPQEKFKR